MKQHCSNIIKPGIPFSPSHPIICVNVYYNNKAMEIDWDIVECLSFLDSPGRWIKS